MRFSQKIIPGVVLLAIILSMAPVGVPVAHAVDNGVTTGPTLEQAGKTTNSSGKVVDVSNISCSNSVAQCVAFVVYWAGPGIASYVAYIGSYFFSIVIQLSLNSLAYALDFLSNGWTTVRDIANMAFIFILIYIALTVMLFAETSGTIKTLALVIVIALLVNFSFFFSRLIIDTGNILAIQFYNAIPVGTYADAGGNQTSATINGVKDLSASIMDSVKLQTLYSSASFDKASKTCGAGNGEMCGMIVTSVIFLSVAAMFWMLFFAFLQVGIKFMLRIVGLWFLLIASPLAFVAKTIPKTAGYFDQWFKKMVEFSFYPAIFLFMFLILTGFTKQLLRADSGGGSIFEAAVNSGAGASASTGVGSAIAIISIRMGFVLALMYVALHVSEWVVTQGSAMASKATGWSVGKAVGTGAFAARLGIGGAGNMIAKSSTLANSKSRIAQGLWQSGRFLSRQSFDPRNISGVSKGASILGGVDVGEGGGKGGWRATEMAAHAWQDKIRKESADDRNAVNANLAKIKGREDARRMGILNTYNVPETDKQIEGLLDKKLRTGVLSTDEQDKLDSLNKHKSEVEKKEGKTWDEVKTEYAITEERVKSFSTPQVTALKGADIEGIVRQMSEAQLKAIKESGKYAGKVVDGIARKWHEENKKAPIGESVKQLGLLGKVHETLKGMGVNLREINKYAGVAPGSKVTIDLKGAEEMKKQIISEKESFEAVRDDRTAAAADRTAAGEKAKKLNKALEHAEKIIEKIKDVPEQVGNVAAPAAFEYTAS